MEVLSSAKPQCMLICLAEPRARVVANATITEARILNSDISDRRLCWDGYNAMVEGIGKVDAGGIDDRLMDTYLEQTEFSRAGRAGYAGGFEGQIPCTIGRVISCVLQGMGVDSG